MDWKPWPAKAKPAKAIGATSAPDVRFEEVGAHAGDVAHVVTDVVGDRGRVARIVLGNARLHLADEVGADVGGLGVDAAADPREQGDRRTAEGDGREHVECFRRFRCRVEVEYLDEQEVAQGETEEAKPGHGETHHRTAAECQRQSLGDAALARRLSRPGIGCGCDPHADETGERRECCAEDVGDGAPRPAPVEEDEDEDREDGDEAGNCGVFAPNEGHRALSNRPHQLLEALTAGVGAVHLPCIEPCERKGA